MKHFIRANYVITFLPIKKCKKILFTQSFDAKLAAYKSNNLARKLRQKKPTTTHAQLTPHWFGDIAPVRNKFV